MNNLDLNWLNFVKTFRESIMSLLVFQPLKEADDMKFYFLSKTRTNQNESFSSLLIGFSGDFPNQQKAIKLYAKGKLIVSDSFPFNGTCFFWKPRPKVVT
jgi:hypothetical protein